MFLYCFMIFDINNINNLALNINSNQMANINAWTVLTHPPHELVG